MCNEHVVVGTKRSLSLREQSSKCTMAARLHNKESMSSEFKKKDGSWFLSMVVPQSYDKNRKVTSVLIANRDVTEEKLRELRQEEELLVCWK